MLSRAVGLVVAVGLAFGGVTVSAAHADAAVMEPPSCVRVPLGGGDYRLYVDPGSVVKGPVREVRVSQTQLRERRDGTWTGVVANDPSPGFGWHVVVKSNAKLFSERRFSTWVVCDA